MSIGGIELGAAYISILPTTDKLAPAIRKEMDSAGLGQGTATKTGSKMGGLLTKGLKTATKASLAGGALFAGIAAKKGIDRLMGIEDARASLSGLGHETKAIDKIMGSALTSVRGTAFGMADAGQAAAAAVGAGVAPGKELTKYLKLTADAATIARVDLGSMSAMMDKVQGSGKLTGGVLRHMGLNGLQVMPMLVKAFKKPQDEVEKMVSRGEVSAAQFQKILTENIGGAALKSGDTTRGAFANMGASIGRVGANLLSGVFPQIKGGFSGITTMLGPLEERAAGWGKALGATLGDLKTNLGPLLASAADLLGNFIKGMQDGTGVGGAFASVVAALVASLKTAVSVGATVTKWLANHKPVVVGLIAAYAALKIATLAYAAAEAVAKGGGMLAYLTKYAKATKIGTFATKAYAAAQWLLNVAMSANPLGLILIGLVALGAALFIAWKKSDTFRSIVTGAFNAVRTAASAVLTWLKSAVATAINFVRNNWKKLVVILGGPIGAAALLVIKNFDKIKGAARTVIAVAKSVGNGFKAIWTGVSTWVGKAWDFIAGLPGKIKGIFSGIWSGLAQGLKSAINSVLHLPITLPRVNTHIPGVGTVGGQTLIPALAKGGIVDSPTFALIGEAGPEAVVPLKQYDAMQAQGSAVHASASRSSAASAPAAAPRVEFVITNWRTGEGFFREIAEDTFNGEEAFAGTTRRMH